MKCKKTKILKKQKDRGLFFKNPLTKEKQKAIIANVPARVAELADALA